MDLFGPFLIKQVHLVFLNSSVRFLSDKIHFVKAVIILPLDLSRPRRITLSMNEDESSLFEIRHYYSGKDNNIKEGK